MTQDEIIAMATQVYGECVWHESALLRLEAFVKLVAAKRTWVGLTTDEIEKVWQNVETSDFEDCVQPFAQAIEAKLKDKNCAG